MIKLLFTFCFLACLPSSLLAQSQSRFTGSEVINYPGGIVQIDLEKSGNQPPNVRFGTKEVLVLNKGRTWRALFGIDLETIPGEYLIYVKPAAKSLESYTKKFNVGPLDRKEQSSHTGIANPEINKSLTELDFENSRPPRFPFVYPVKGSWTNRFGQVQSSTDIANRNNQASYVTLQNYLSLTTTAIETIHAPQDGFISLIAPYQADTYSVYVDHGRNIYSIVHGVSDLNIEVGNGIVRDAVIGKVATSTNIDSPTTVIWQTIFNGVFVNPELLTKIR